MSKENEHHSSEAESGGNIALIGEEKREVSFQVLQSIYNELTGKSEEVARRYDTPIRVTLEDLIQLDHLIDQMCEPLHIQSKSLSITVYYDEDTREIFSSFDRFKIMDKSSLSPVENIVFKYNFLIIPPKSRKPQNQTLTIQISSLITILEKFRRDNMPAKMFKFGIIGLGSYTAIVTVQYVDYVMARNLLDGVERWVKGLPSKSFPKWFTCMRNNSEHIGSVLTYLVLACAAYIFILFVPQHVSNETRDLQELVRFSIIGALSMFGALRFGRFIGRRIEHTLDAAKELSYIQLNRGDDKQIEAARRRNKKDMFIGALSAIGTLAIGIAASVVAYWLVA